ncbi:hypothetical protein FA15DRAFT_730823 [Coprinopsis marcescibilis]|uniref:CFEM domain-containing protein n=1 Tax=Coprinopsis marcescibilis TaxID=230819 RepID=A0A5C3KER5_COPMA|nr:hypothetical protein FA15DRAFT_730823 [Coprinopsis marcescibilis]
MRSISVALFAIASAGLVASKYPTINDLSPCHRDCLVASALAVNCTDAADQLCVCRHAQFSLDLGGCLKSNCKVSEEASLGTEVVAEVVCEEAGVTGTGTTGAPRTFTGISTQTAVPKRNAASSINGVAWVPLTAVAGIVALAL